MGSSGVFTDPDSQYVVASIRPSEDADAEEIEQEVVAIEEVEEEAEDRFVLETDDESRAPSPLTTSSTRVSPDHRRPVVVFAPPSPLSESNPRIRDTETDRSWSFSDDQRELLAESSPRFELNELRVPERVSQGEQLSVSLSAENVSEVDGRFLTAVEWPTKQIADDNEAEIVRRSVDAGETVTESLSIDTEYTTFEEESVSLSVQGHVTANREVQVEDVDED